MTLLRSFLVGALIGVVAACSSAPPPVVLPDGGAGSGAAGGSSNAGGGAADAGLPFRTACTTLNAKRCELLRSCGVIADTTDAYRGCLAWLSATWCGPTKWVPRVEKGTLRYDGVRAQTCASDWAARACSDWATEPTSCARFLAPAVTLGGRCYDGYQECADGVCRGAACPRTCVTRGAIGDSCTATTDCASTLYCRQAGAAGQCAAYSTEMQPCSTTQLCATGFLCVAGLCRRLPTVEQPCLQGTCDDVSYCVASVDGGQCEARHDAGVGCSDDSQCGAGLLCDTTKQECAPLQVPALGGECSPRQQCPSGSACIVESGATRGACSALRRDGEACSAPADCQGHLTCVEADGGRRCGPRRPNGASCATARDCLALSACVSGSCVALPALGEGCSTSLPCLWGACVDVPDAGALCIEPQGPGQACRSGADCASGRCEQGLCTAACLP